MTEDTISRQAVLDEINRVAVKVFETYDDYANFYDFVAELPPVNPQKPICPSAGIDCEDCINRQAAIDAIKNYASMLWEKYHEPFPESTIMEMIQELPPVTPQLKTRWIPVSERLPEEDKTVIASTKYGVYPEAKYTKEYGWEWLYEAGTEYWVELEDVEAWMPLPEPYKAESESI